jgi:hypothetical protein
MKDNLITAVLVNSLGGVRENAKKYRLLGGQLRTGEHVTFAKDALPFKKKHGIFHRLRHDGTLEIQELRL